MKFRTIQATIITACLCACMTALSGCSKQVNEPYETPSGDSLTASSADSSSESGEISSNNTLDESSSKPQASKDDEYPYKSIRLDHEYLETVEQDILNVTITLKMSTEALREEYNKIYPNYTDPYHWFRFLRNRGEQIVKKFLSDYGIVYDEHAVLESSASFFGDFDKSLVSSMLDDPRVVEIYYEPVPLPPLKYDESGLIIYHLDRDELNRRKEDVFYLWIDLHMDTEALREEYNEIYPNYTDTLHWSEFLCSKGEQIVKEFLLDYGVAYEDVSLLESSAEIRGYFDRSVVSSMLDDPRVADITYFVGGPPR